MVQLHLPNSNLYAVIIDFISLFSLKLTHHNYTCAFKDKNTF